MKRTFIYLLAVVLMAGVSMPSEAKNKKQKKDIAIQLYSVRSLIGVFGHETGDYNQALRDLAGMGYTAVEAASYGDGKLYGKDPAQFKADVEAAGMRVMSSHITHNLSREELASGDFSAALAWWDQCIAAHAAAGAEYIVTPSMPQDLNLKDLRTYCNYFNEVGKRCAARGIKYGYHNHSAEFDKVEGQVKYDFMLQNTNPAYVFFEMDVYWAVWGHVSPVEYFQKYPGRFKLLHIKDKRELGQSGMVGFDAIFKYAPTAGVENIVVELEESKYPNIIDGVRESIEYLQKASFVPKKMKKSK